MVLKQVSTDGGEESLVESMADSCSALPVFAPLVAMDDDQIMRSVQSDDNHLAFAHLMGRWEDRILRLCERLIHDPCRAEDLKQEAFVRVYTKRRDYDPKMRFSTWLWAIASNLCYDELRKHSRRKRYADDQNGNEDLFEQYSSPDFSPDHDAACKEEILLVQQALKELPESYRQPLVLRFQEGLRLREIADFLGIAESTVRYRLTEGLTQMSAILGHKFRNNA